MITFVYRHLHAGMQPSGEVVSAVILFGLLNFGHHCSLDSKSMVVTCHVH